MDAAARVDISVVVPLYNEKDNLGDLHQQLSPALAPLGRPFEIVLVDDGSTDGTRERAAGARGSATRASWPCCCAGTSARPPPSRRASTARAATSW